MSQGRPWWLIWLRICLRCRRPGTDPWVRKILWRKEWLPTPVFILVWRIPWREEPGGLESTGSQRVGHEWGLIEWISSTVRKIFFFNLPLAAHNGKPTWSSSAVNTRDVYQHQARFDSWGNWDIEKFGDFSQVKWLVSDPVNNCTYSVWLQNSSSWELPGSPVVRTPHFHWVGELGSIPAYGILQASEWGQKQ